MWTVQSDTGGGHNTKLYTVTISSFGKKVGPCGIVPCVAAGVGSACNMRDSQRVENLNVTKDFEKTKIQTCTVFSKSTPYNGIFQVMQTAFVE
jgi:hypothetical protein